MRRYYSLILAGLLILIIGVWLITKKKDGTPAHINIKTAAVAATGKAIEVQPFVTEAGWGYVIYMQGKPYIRQNTIPVIEGNQGFRTREKALQAGQLVAYKIEHAILPPTVNKQELDSLQLLN